MPIPYGKAVSLSKGHAASPPQARIVQRSARSTTLPRHANPGGSRSPSAMPTPHGAAVTLSHKPRGFAANGTHRAAECLIHHAAASRKPGWIAISERDANSSRRSRHSFTQATRLRRQRHASCSGVPDPPRCRVTQTRVDRDLRARCQPLTAQPSHFLTSHAAPPPTARIVQRSA
ncbi:MAG: hypothetical protein WEB60_05405 [Terrimicrobiaceae bacterium]